MHGKNIKKPAILILLIQICFCWLQQKKHPKKGILMAKTKVRQKKTKKKVANVARLYLDGSTSLAVAPSYTFLFATKI